MAYETPHRRSRDPCPMRSRLRPVRTTPTIRSEPARRTASGSPAGGAIVASLAPWVINPFFLLTIIGRGGGDQCHPPAGGDGRDARRGLPEPCGGSSPECWGPWPSYLAMLAIPLWRSVPRHPIHGALGQRAVGHARDQVMLQLGRPLPPSKTHRSPSGAGPRAGWGRRGLPALLRLP